METFVFLSITWERNILLAQIENICFICPISVGIKDNVVFCFPAIFVLLFFIFFCPFFFFHFYFWTGICAQSEDRAENQGHAENTSKQESHKIQILVPRFTKEAKHKRGNDSLWHWKHTHKKRKSCTILLLYKRRGETMLCEDENYSDFFFNFAFTFWPFHKWTDWTLAPNRWEQKKENRKKNNNKYYKLISFLFWIPQEVLVPSLWHLCLLTPQAQWDLVRE